MEVDFFFQMKVFFLEFWIHPSPKKHTKQKVDSLDALSEWQTTTFWLGYSLLQSWLEVVPNDSMILTWCTDEWVEKRYIFLRQIELKDLNRALVASQNSGNLGSANPKCKYLDLGSPPFIGHEVRPCKERVPTTSRIGDLRSPSLLVFNSKNPEKGALRRSRQRHGLSPWKTSPLRHSFRSIYLKIPTKSNPIESNVIMVHYFPGPLVKEENNNPFWRP